MATLPRPLARMLARTVIHPLHRLRRGATLGVRVLLADTEQRVLLVRHTYTPGWMLPGGGVEPGQTCLDAVRCELDEEVGVTLLEPPRLVGILANFASQPGDHVALYYAHQWKRRPVTSPEIAAADLFPLRALPAETSPATRRRVAEYLGEAPVAEHW
ncbi:NUDIX domain-containing protein [Rhodoligotrophos defluvii]|uniref:NUDIX domain-containing protein n=1 Tax=Rhodoligotrophos defluvii TaxID=2561934 RepID=UPI001EF0EC3B|nr:NUDIX domain-containing protein [Rhodoligotrophos defluvii]